MNPILQEFKDSIEAVFYFYLNALQCSRKDHDEKKASLETLLRKMEQISKDLTTREAILKNHLIAIKNYSKPRGEDLLHVVPHLIAVEASAPGSSHEAMLGASLIMETYSLWEEVFRGRLATKVGKNKNDIKSDFWGEARHYRISIAHHNRCAVNDLENCKILPCHTNGAPLKLTDQFIVSYVGLAIRSIEALEIEYFAQHGGVADAATRCS